VGYTPDLVAGLYLGFDDPAPLGRGSTGGGLSAPIFNAFMQKAVEGTRPGKFVVPEGMSLIPVNRKTGMAAVEGEPDTIIEAFKPGTGPADTFSVIGDLDEYAPPEEILRTSPQANQAVTSGSNGLF
jgi:penicillin-binding protein 1A